MDEVFSEILETAALWPGSQVRPKNHPKGAPPTFGWELSYSSTDGEFTYKEWQFPLLPDLHLYIGPDIKELVVSPEGRQKIADDLNWRIGLASN